MPALVKEVLWRASTMLQDIAPQFNSHTEREMVDWLNDGQMALAKFMPSICTRTDSIWLRPGTRQSIRQIPAANIKDEQGQTPRQDVFGVQLVSLVCNMGSDGATPGRAIPQPTRRTLLDINRPDWHSSVGDVVRQYVFDPQLPTTFYVEPGVKPLVPTWVQLSYVAQPMLIPNTGSGGADLYGLSGNSTFRISVGDECVEDLVNYICARAFLKNAEGSIDDGKAQRYEQLFVGSLNARVAAITGTNPNLKRMPFNPSVPGSAS